MPNDIDSEKLKKAFYSKIEKLKNELEESDRNELRQLIRESYNISFVCYDIYADFIKASSNLYGSIIRNFKEQLNKTGKRDHRNKDSIKSLDELNTKDEMSVFLADELSNINKLNEIESHNDYKTHDNMLQCINLTVNNVSGSLLKLFTLDDPDMIRIALIALGESIKSLIPIFFVIDLIDSILKEYDKKIYEIKESGNLHRDYEGYIDNSYHLCIIMQYIINMYENLSTYELSDCTCNINELDGIQEQIKNRIKKFNADN